MLDNLVPTQASNKKNSRKSYVNEKIRNASTISIPFFGAIKVPPFYHTIINLVLI